MCCNVLQTIVIIAYKTFHFYGFWMNVSFGEFCSFFVYGLFMDFGWTFDEICSFFVDGLFMYFDGLFLDLDGLFMDLDGLLMDLI